MDCIFCKIVEEEVPSYKVWEDDTHIAFLNIWPNTEGYTVVASKSHETSDPSKAEEGAFGDTALAARSVATKLVGAFDDVERCGIIFDGTGVDHLHAHVVPMHGTVNNKWKEANPVKKTDFHELFQGYLSTHNSDEADQSKLQKVADRIKGA